MFNFNQQGNSAKMKTMRVNTVLTGQLQILRLYLLSVPKEAHRGRSAMGMQLLPGQSYVRPIRSVCKKCSGCHPTHLGTENIKMERHRCQNLLHRALRKHKIINTKKWQVHTFCIERGHSWILQVQRTAQA